jgi:NAD(P)H-dependent flavin oxidoreductase YrpB (nitropropane dioxygenase family)
MGDKKMLKLPATKFVSLSFSMMMSAENGEAKDLWAQARYANSGIVGMKAIYDGDIEKGMFYAGQCIDGIADLPSIKELIDDVIPQTEKTATSIQAKIT